MRPLPGRCIELLQGLLAAKTGARGAGRDSALQRVAEAAVTALDEIEAPAVPSRAGNNRGGSTMLQAIERTFAEIDALEDAELDALENGNDELPAGGQGRSVNAALVANLLTALGKLDATEATALGEAAARKIAARPAVFDPGTVVVPALRVLRAEDRQSGSAWPDAAETHLWEQSSDFLLRRSESPPEPPTDWRQDAAVSCRCADCRELQTFVLDPVERVHRFRVRQDRRQHLHQTIDRHGLEMTHVTERKGSPQTLVCTKDRRSYRRRCDQYKQDIDALAALADLAEKDGAGYAAWLRRINAARVRHGNWSPA
ncbi:MAG: hypothetical protein ACREF9_20855, partial [Opitutaceae bacterium]